MKKVIISGCAVLALAACSNEKSNNTDNNSSMKDSFIGKETISIESAKFSGVDERGVFYTPGPTKVHTTVLVEVTDELYHEYVISQSVNDKGVESTPILKESIYKYSVKDNGVVQLEMVADACGVYKSDEEEKKTFKPLVSSNSMVSVNGQTVLRASKEDLSNKISEIEKNKKDDVYTTECSEIGRSIENTARSVYDSLFGDEQPTGTTK